MLDFTVAIRTHNRAEYLPALLEKLKAQVQTEVISWEVVIVDNNSRDGTQECISKYQEVWDVCPLRYVVERKQGASYARQRAISEAQGKWVAFLDDDNIPGPHWLSAAYTFGKNHPKAAAFGGQIHPQYEIDPPQHFERIAAFIPVIERNETICYTAGRWAFTNLVPPGAGLVILRQAWQAHVPDELCLKGPVGKGLAQKGEDVEALLHLKKAGWEIWFNPEMHIYHQIPRQRLERDYLMRFFHGVGLSKYQTRMIPHQPWQRPLMTLVYMASDLRRILYHLIKHRQDVWQDLVAACELQLFISSLWSPFYTWGETQR